MELARIFIKYKWLIFACILAWSFAVAGRIYVEEAKAETTWSPSVYAGESWFARDYDMIEFDAELATYNILKLGIGDVTGTGTVKVCSGHFSAWNVCSLVYEETLPFTPGASTTDGYSEFRFSGGIDVTIGNRYFLVIQDGNNLKFGTASSYGQTHAFGGWDTGGASLTWSDSGSTYFRNFALGYDDDQLDSTAISRDVRVYNDPFFEQHHLDVPSLQWCPNNGEPCYINFSFNDLSWESGIKLYNDAENGTYTGTYLASTTPLEFYPKLSGRIQLPYTATTTEGYDYFCLRLYDVDAEYPDEVTCGIKVMFLNDSTLTCAWDKTIYENEHDADTICSDIATSSIWEAGSWPGAMECAGRKVGYWLTVASSSDYYNLCKASLDTKDKFPINIITDFSRRINAYAGQDKPATYTQAMLPLFWNGTTTGADLLPVASIRAEAPAYDTIYNWLEIIIWLYALYIIIWDLLGLARKPHEQTEPRA